MEISIIIELKYFVNLIVGREPLKNNGVTGVMEAYHGCTKEWWGHRGHRGYRVTGVS